jgi:hypothetical protein
MSNIADNTALALPTEPSPGPTMKQILEGIRDNFVLVSATALLIGVTLATTFLAAYLSIFDWHLIWFVQYTDIITFGLIALGIVSGSITSLQGLAQVFLGGATPKQRRVGLMIAVGLAIAGLAFDIWGSVHRGEGYSHIVSGGVAVGTALAIIFVVAAHVEARSLPSAIQCMWVLLLLVIGAGSLGRWLGESVKETSDFDQNIYLKDQTLNNVKLVIVMSRHTVLLKDAVLNIVPTGDIAKFQTINNNAKPK